ncbi:MAG: sporulation protein YunB, partial [Bacilli bacterium]
GPKIPVKIHFIGNVTSSVSSKVTSYGINNAMMEAFVKVNINVQIALPLSLEEISVMTEIPIAMKMIQGQVPNYYQKGYDRDSLLLSTPIIK